MKQLEPSYITGGNQNSTAPLEDALTVFYKTTHALATQPGNPTSLPYINKKMFLYNIYVNVYNSFIHNCEPKHPQVSR